MKVRAEISSKNKYYISKHRYYELKHFCLQYPEWKKCYNDIDNEIKSSSVIRIPKDYKQPSDTDSPTFKNAMEKVYYSNRMDMVRKAAMEADNYLYMYILKAVTEEKSYDYLKNRLNMPCSKDMYYDRYRKFFYLLSNKRQ